MKIRCVVPYIGTWIETDKILGQIHFDCVVPYIGTWIETVLPKWLTYRERSYLI